MKLEKLSKNYSRQRYFRKVQEAEFEFDEKELEKYIDSVIKETKKEHKY